MTSFTRFAIFTTLKLNQAVSIQGTYRINSDLTTDWAAIENPDLETSISYGRWTRLWVMVKSPLGNIYYGRRGFQQGCGLQFSSADTAEDIFRKWTQDRGSFSVGEFLGTFYDRSGFLSVAAGLDTLLEHRGSERSSINSCVGIYKILGWSC